MLFRDAPFSPVVMWRSPKLRMFVRKLQADYAFDSLTPGVFSALDCMWQCFFMRDFLYSEISNFYKEPNIPNDPDVAIEVGRRLCGEILEPLNATFGRIAIRSAYRSEKVNSIGNKKGHSCATNDKNYAGHIWDHPDSDGKFGATACVVVPWFADRYDDGADWRSMAYWIHNHLPYSELEFYPRLAAFNITWHQQPKRRIYSYIKPSAELAPGTGPDESLAHFYAGFPRFREGPKGLPFDETTAENSPSPIGKL